MTQATATTKRCPRCGEVQPLTGFSVDRSKASGRKSHCRTCDNAKSQIAYYGKHDRPVPSARPAPASRRCEACAAEITGYGKRYCSRRCANGWTPKPIRHCPVCGDAINDWAETWCSRDCRRFGALTVTTCDLPLASCPCCRNVFTVRRGHGSCGNTGCYHKLTYVRGAAKPCETCGADVPSRQGSPRWCDDGCYRQSPQYKATRQRVHRRRRARKHSAVSEAYSPEAIYQRDGWRCHLCSGPLKRDADVPHPKAPTIDHLVPLAQGGDDTRANVRAAHFLCNSKKGARGGGEQLMLVG